VEFSKPIENSDSTEFLRIYKLDLKKVEITENDSLWWVDLSLSDFEITTPPPGQKDSVPPPPKKGHYVLHVNSDPDGARVYLNGELLEGTTPLTIAELPAGKHNLSVRKYLRGVDWWGETTVDLKQMDTTKLTIKLQKPRTRLKIQSVPAGAEVYLNDSPNLNHMPRYITDTTLVDLRPGPDQTLYFFKVGYYDTTVSVSVEAYMPNLISVDLKPVSDDLELLDKQMTFVKQRKKRWIGRGLLYSSIAPALSGLVTLWLADRDWAKAADFKHMYEDAAFHSAETDRFIRENQRLNRSGDLKASIAAAMETGFLLLAVTGLVLQF